MKNPHDTSEYTTVTMPDESNVENSASVPDSQNSDSANVGNGCKTENRKKKKKFSGAYYYADTEDGKLKETAFARTALTVIAFMLQIIVLLLPQGGLEYITDNIPSYAYAYMWIVFIMIAVSVWLFVMNAKRYKIVKRIPVEYAPKKGFKRRAYLGAELYIAINALMFVMELSFVCIHYDGWGLVAMFICLAATAAAIGARTVTWLALRNSELIQPPA